MKRWSLLIPILGLCMALVITACRRDEEPDAVEELPTPETVDVTPKLTAGEPVVEYRERELATGRELEADETVDLVPGANVITSDGGWATLAWTDFLTQTMVTGTDVLLSLSQPELRYAIIDQATGSARYQLQGSGEPATVTVKAASWSDVEVTEGEADFYVSIVPGIEPAAWIVVRKGEATVLRGDDTLILGKGQVAAVTAEGEMPQPAAFGDDLELLEDWFDDMEANKDVGAITMLAFRCSVLEDDTAIYSEPSDDSDSAGDPLAAGTSVSVVQRDEPGDWLRVQTADGTEGWVEASALDCNGPVSAVSLNPPGEESEGPTTTPPPLPTRRPSTPVPTIVIGTPTATWTPAASGESTIKFSVDDDEIWKGECTTLRWEFTNIQAWYLDGEGGVGDTGEKEICPDEDTTYKLRVIKANGEEETREIEVEVRERPTDTPEPTEGAEPTETPLALPSNTPIPPPADTDTPIPPPPADTDTPVPPPADTDTPVPPPADTDTPEPPPPADTDTPEPPPPDPTETPEP